MSNLSCWGPEESIRFGEGVEAEVRMEWLCPPTGGAEPRHSPPSDGSVSSNEVLMWIGSEPRGGSEATSDGIGMSANGSEDNIGESSDETDVVDTQVEAESHLVLGMVWP